MTYILPAFFAVTIFVWLIHAYRVSAWAVGLAG